MASEAITLARKGIDAFNRADWPATRDLTADPSSTRNSGRRAQGVKTSRLDMRPVVTHVTADQVRHPRQEVVQLGVCQCFEVFARDELQQLQAERRSEELGGPVRR